MGRVRRGEEEEKGNEVEEEEEKVGRRRKEERGGGDTDILQYFIHCFLCCLFDDLQKSKEQPSSQSCITSTETYSVST